MFFFTAVMLVLSAVADETKEGVVEDQTFLVACQKGFAEQFGKSSEAICFGSGEFTLLASGRMPPPFKCQQSHCEGTLPVPEKESLRRLKKETNQPCTRESKKVAWFAFRDDQGILNVAVNAVMGDYESSLVWRHDDGRQWEAWRTHILGSTKWLVTKEVKFTWLALGPVKDKKDLERKLKVLSDLKVVQLEP